MTRPRPHKNGGFTIVEILASFLLLTLVFSGFAGIIVNSLKNFRNSQEKYIAAKIAQEGIELAVNKKDNHVTCVFADPSCPIATWQENLLGTFEVEAADTSKLLPNNQFNPFNASRFLCILEHPSMDAGKYGYCSSGAYLSPKYTRQVTITSLNSYSVIIKSIVTWRSTKTLTLETIVYSK